MQRTWPGRDARAAEITSEGPGPVAIVTGGSRGIGRACATELARQGYAVVVNYAADTVAAEDTVADLRSVGSWAVAMRGDAADESAMAAVFDRAESEFGGVDAVVHAAGRMKLASMVDLDLDDLDGLVRTNIRGTFVVDRLAARRLRPGGSIINFSTSVVRTGFPTYGAYAATKGAVEALTLILARELRGRDITVNAIAPGPTATALFFDGKSAEEVDRLALGVPLERLGEPDDIARIVAFLVSSAGRWINGQVVRANGGLV